MNFSLVVSLKMTLAGTALTQALQGTLHQSRERGNPVTTGAPGKMKGPECPLSREYRRLSKCHSTLIATCRPFLLLRSDPDLPIAYKS